MTTYYATAFKGIGQIAVRELRHQFGDAPKKIRTFKVRDYDIVQFDWPDQAVTLTQLGTTEDIFYHLATIPLTGDRTDLKNLQETTQASPINTALNDHRDIQGPPRGRTTYRIIIQASMQKWQTYRRSHMQQAVAQNIHTLFPKWRQVPDDANLEFWLQQTGKEALLGLRLTKSTMRHRTYKIANRPASLRPTIARAVVLLTRPQDDDLFLDPMCGAGTLLIERALSNRHQMLYGGDIDPEAITCTFENFGNKHKPHHIQTWDAQHLPLPDQSITKIATNPPWGRQIGTPSQLRTLYQITCTEMDRVLQTNGIVAILTSEWDILKRTLEKTSLTLIDHIKDIGVLGRRADIFVLQKFIS